MKPKDKESLLKILKAEPSNDGYQVYGGPIAIDFDPSVQITCERITIYCTDVFLNNLNLIGSLKFSSCNVSLSNSVIIRNDSEQDTVLIADDSTNLEAINVSIDAKKVIAAYSNNRSTSKFQKCSFKNCLFGCFADENSSIQFHQSTINCDEDQCNGGFCSLLDHSSFEAVNCDFHRCSNDPISLENYSKLLLNQCQFFEINESFVYSKSFSESQIENCSFFSENTERVLLFFTSSSAKIFDCTFKTPNINSIKGTNDSNIICERCKFEDAFSPSFVVTNHSKGTLSQCQFSNIHANSILSESSSEIDVDQCKFQNGDYPSIVFYDKVNGVIKNCLFSNIKNAGIAVREESTSHISDCSFESCTVGISASSQSKAQINHCFIKETIHYSILSFDLSVLEIENCEFTNSGIAFFHSFTGGLINVKNSKIYHNSSSSSFLSKIIVNGSLILSNIEILSNIQLSHLFEDVNKVNQQNVKLNDKLLQDLDIDNHLQNVLLNKKCLDCKLPADGPYFDCCLHKPLCSKCFNSKKIEECPLCNRKISKLYNQEKIETEDICPVCYENSACSIIIPCGHRFCSQCIDSWHKEDSKECMICHGTELSVKLLPQYYHESNHETYEI